jgi:hypothetical protein
MVALESPLAKTSPSGHIYYVCARRVRFAIAISLACFSLIATFSCKEMGTY